MRGTKTGRVRARKEGSRNLYVANFYVLYCRLYCRLSLTVELNVTILVPGNTKYYDAVRTLDKQKSKY